MPLIDTDLDGFEVSSALRGVARATAGIPGGRPGVYAARKVRVTLCGNRSSNLFSTSLYAILSTVTIGADGITSLRSAARNTLSGRPAFGQ
jgi:hypothetical protein